MLYHIHYKLQMNNSIKFSALVISYIYFMIHIRINWIVLEYKNDSLQFSVN